MKTSAFLFYMVYFLFWRAAISSSMLPGSQRRGFGEAVMRHALAEVRQERGMER